MKEKTSKIYSGTIGTEMEVRIVLKGQAYAGQIEAQLASPNSRNQSQV
jgi:hypothetical protein